MHDPPAKRRPAQTPTPQIFLEWPRSPIWALAVKSTAYLCRDFFTLILTFLMM
jgi:hypothetical protein